MVTVSALLPAIALAGVTEASTATGLPIVKVTALEVPPPGVGLTTVTLALPLLLSCDAGTEAERLVELTYVVTSPDWFHSACEPWMNPVPVTVSVNAEPSSAALVGEIAEIAGVGFEEFPPSPPGPLPPPQPARTPAATNMAVLTNLRRRLSATGKLHLLRRGKYLTC